MTVLVTGVAGFIGFHLAEALLDRGDSVVGIDNLNDYYDPALKQARLHRLEHRDGFDFSQTDIADEGQMVELSRRLNDVTAVVHLAAQAGVRFSMLEPGAYARDNLVGHLNVLELCRHLDGLRHLVYASSSSVYGGNVKLPYSEDDPVDRPHSLYGATKKADELMSYCYAHLYDIPATGLRFFTVYGPWGRPDMAYYSFTEAVFRGETIHVFNHGDMKRDFTYIDDVIAGVVAAVDHPPEGRGGAAPHRVYNIGNSTAEPLMHLIEAIESAVGKKAQIRMAPMQPGDVRETWADIAAARRDLGFEPKTALEDGIPLFVQWFRDYHGF